MDEMMKSGIIKNEVFILKLVLQKFQHLNVSRGHAS